jgi:hypothetical protein
MPKKIKIHFLSSAALSVQHMVSNHYKSRDSILYLGVTVLVYRRYRDEKDDSYSSEVNSKYFACLS